MKRNRAAISELCHSSALYALVVNRKEINYFVVVVPEGDLCNVVRRFKFTSGCALPHAFHILRI